MLVVAVARIVFDASAFTLKEKRRIKRSLVDRTRRKFIVSIAEIEDNDNPSLLTLGLSYVSNSSSHAASAIDHVLSYMESLYLAPLIYKEREILDFGTLNDPLWDEVDDFSTWEAVKNDRNTIPFDDNKPKR